MADNNLKDSAVLDAAVSRIDNRTKKHTSRRNFIGKALVSAIAVTTTAGLAKKTASYITVDNSQDKYRKDVQAGDLAMIEQKYVLMSEAEKKEFVENLVREYNYEPDSSILGG